MLFPLDDLGPEQTPTAELDRRCTAARSGTGPAGETCGTCRHLVGVHHHNGRYLKCGLVRHAWTHGAGSDIRAKWEACAEWQPV